MQDGVRQQTNPVQLDQDGRVPDVEQPAGDFYAPIRGSRSGEYAESDAITSTSSAMISSAQTGWYGIQEELPDRTYGREHDADHPRPRGLIEDAETLATTTIPKIRCSQPQAVTSTS